jgi:adenosine deaminase
MGTNIIYRLELIMRDINRLPKAHLHLHFIGSMRGSTLLEFCQEKSIQLPHELLYSSKVMLEQSARGWHQFQTLYEIARSCVDSPQEIQRIIFEAVEDDRNEGSRRLEIQLDPSSFSPIFDDSLEQCVEFVLDQLQAAGQKYQIETGLIIATSRLRGESHALKLARIAIQYRDAGIVGFGLSNDERMGQTSEFVPAFNLIHDQGLIAVPHGGEILGPNSLHDIINLLNPQRIGHGVTALLDPQLIERIVEQSITLEFSPVSNRHLGVVNLYKDFPLRQFLDLGVRCTLNADDPLLFERRLNYQFEIARKYMGATDSDLALLARNSVLGSTASQTSQTRWLKEIEQWESIEPGLN